MSQKERNKGLTHHSPQEKIEEEKTKSLKV
jgi:hypothetical protein